jgi:hypothetical protein
MFIAHATREFGPAKFLQTNLIILSKAGNGNYPSKVPSEAVFIVVGNPSMNELRVT